MNQSGEHDDPLVTHLMNLFTASVLTYAVVTRGGLRVARGLERLAQRSR